MLSPNVLLQNRYLILRQLGRGGMGAVYEARDQRLGNLVALKETFFAEEEMRKAFHREASILATLRHQSLPKVIDHFSEGEGQFLVMEFIRGDDLSKLLKIHGAPVPQRDAVTWADQLLGVLEYLHSQRPPVIHRDIKPQNLKLTEHGEVILLDFGLAKEATLDASLAPRSVRGFSLNYSPLEQIQGIGTDPRSDLYSVAATFYHLMTGAVPPDAVSRATALIEGQPDPLRPAHELNPEVSPGVSAVLEQALAQERTRRPTSASAMRSALRQAANADLQAKVGATTQKLPTAPATIPPPNFQVAQPKPAVPLYQPPDLNSHSGELATSGRKRKWIPGAAVVLIIVLTAIVLWLMNREETSGVPKNNTDTFSSIGKTLPLNSRELLARGSDEERLYSFIAEAGELTFKLDALGDGSTVTIAALDGARQLMRFNGDKPSFSVSSSGEHEQATARLIVDREQPILLRVKTTSPKNLQAFRLRIDGPAKLADTKPPSPELKALNDLFAGRDRPLPLVSNAVFGSQAGKKETYYEFTAGPGEVNFTLNVISNNGTITVDLFNEDAERLSFDNDRQKFRVSSSGLNEQGSAQLLLDRRQKLLMRIESAYPQRTRAYRLKIEGPVQLAQIDENNQTAAVTEALKSLFTPRDNPEPLGSKEISDRVIDKEKYYVFTAAPGTLRFKLEVEANGTIVIVELFDNEAKLVRFDDNSTKLSVSSAGKKEKKETEITIGREETLLMRLSTNYPESLKNFRLKLDGKVRGL